jgi:hypothetical protein
MILGPLSSDLPTLSQQISKKKKKRNRTSIRKGTITMVTSKIWQQKN